MLAQVGRLWGAVEETELLVLLVLVLLVLVWMHAGDRVVGG